jgi:uncharacterized protein
VSALLIAALLFTVFMTSLLSGVFGMAGGVLLMGVFTALLPVAAAMVTHGAVQLIANAFRAVLHRRHLRWSIAAKYLLGSATIALVLSALSFVPDKPWVFLLLGIMPILVWVPERWFVLDAARPGQAFVVGLIVTGCNLTAGAAGPLLDIFFVRTGLTRHEIVATKAATQVFSHLMKILVYGLPLLSAGERGVVPPAGFFVAMVPLSMAGGWAGGLILDRLSDRGFKEITRVMLTVIGVTYLFNAARLFWG